MNLLKILQDKNIKQKLLSRIPETIEIISEDEDSEQSLPVVNQSAALRNQIKPSVAKVAPVKN